jgi:CubicO group peptidase (beta-lactamase class C family)
MSRLLLLAIALATRGEVAAVADPLAAAVAGGGFPRTTSVLAEQGGAVVLERYFAGSNAGTLNDPRSVGKSITALAVGIAIADGKLPSVDAPAFGYLGRLRPFAHDGPAKRAITLADLLTMSSALACDDNDPASPGNEENMYPQQRWARWAVDLPVKPGYARDGTGRGPWSYCTAGVFLLGQILQQATGQPVDRYVEQRLFAPLGITRWQWNRSPAGEVMTGGQLRLTTRDLAKLGRLVLDGGRWQGKVVVPEAWIRQALTAHRKPARVANPAGDLDYGYLFWRRDYRTACGRGAGTAWFMSGNGGNHVVALPALDAVAVVTRVHYNSRGMHDQSFRLLEDQVLPRVACRRP